LIDDRIHAFPLKSSRGFSYREAGKGQALVLLHGIGSSSAGWVYQLEELGKRFRVIAWNAPGYEESEPLKDERPTARHYAEALHGLIDRLLLKDVVIVANSLGGLFAGAYARAHGERVRSMFLISPTIGYAALGEPLRTEKREGRLKMIEELGPEGLAEKRSPALFGSKMTPEALELARWTQRRVRPAGYRQAIYCLDEGNHLQDARHFRKPVLVVCGSEDTVTPEAGCKQVAQAYPQGQYRSLPGLGHVSYMEDPQILNPMIEHFVS
jgi:pimeloyl-ACP methyl ester carboxylesterase